MSRLRRRRAGAPVVAASGAAHEGSNPLLVEFRSMMADAGEPTAAEIDQLTSVYAFAIPTERALRAIATHSPHGVVELGAGTGYWASLLRDLGVPIVAFDIAPPMSPDNRWFHSSTAWFEVQRGDESAIEPYGDRTLLLVWPTRDQTWPADALDRFHAAGGRTVIYVGEAADKPATPASTHCSARTSTAWRAPTASTTWPVCAAPARCGGAPNGWCCHIGPASTTTCTCACVATCRAIRSGGGRSDTDAREAKGPAPSK